MSAILGFTHGRTAPPRGNQRRILEEMQSLVTHQDFYVKDDLFCDGYICATRSHTDIIQRQPQPYQKEGIYVWLDGEFHNQSELRERIDVGENHDPALLLSLFRQSRDFSFLRQIDGIYAAVIYDSLRQKVHLITDSLGLRHLYWSVHKGCFTWASEVKVMLALPDFKPKINQTAVDDFFGIGYLLEDRTWFEGVELLPPGTALTWDMTQHSLHKYGYRLWDEITPLTGKIDEREITEELGRLFVDAVKRRCRDGERVGLRLSGGCDSRAVLAAMPDRGYPIHAMTFGRRGCADIRIAAAVAKVKGAVHWIAEIDQDNWLAPRVNGVWWTDGHKNLMHMHAMATLTQMRELFDITLGGGFASVSIGSSYMHSKMDETRVIETRVRRFINLTTKIDQIYLESRYPFIDKNLIRFSKAIPRRLRLNAYIYHKMLLKTFPEYFRTIPWQRTGVPISWPPLIPAGIQFLGRVRQRFHRELNRFGLQKKDQHSYADYTSWICQEPARSFFRELLDNPKALYPEFISRKQVLDDWLKHLSGWNRADALCRYLTFEIWLQQVFEKRFRPLKEL